MAVSSEGQMLREGIVAEGLKTPGRRERIKERGARTMR
jgi:hypothetical protein